ncbi:MAG: cyclic pyranopterin monophosphate synthase MoaC [Gammaproteobacteria bacterium]
MKQTKTQAKARLSHLDSAGAARMVDVGEKSTTRRTAKAGGELRMSAAAFRLLLDGAAKKGDVIAVARIAAIAAVKRAADIIPLCHPLPLDHAEANFSFGRGNVLRCEVTVRLSAKTGAEMEALTGVCAGLLTAYDMLKAADKTMTITNIRLLQKTGGKSDINNPAAKSPAVK